MQREGKIKGGQEACARHGEGYARIHCGQGACTDARHMIAPENHCIDCLAWRMATPLHNASLYPLGMALAKAQ